MGKYWALDRLYRGKSREILALLLLLYAARNFAAHLRCVGESTDEEYRVARGGGERETVRRPGESIKCSNNRLTGEL